MTASPSTAFVTLEKLLPFLNFKAFVYEAMAPSAAGIARFFGVAECGMN
ncbi:hypothetical protein H6G91_27855 [Nostoc muscorum FACHB-395]|nr:hypothetical protein [Nostoc sp. C057]MBD2511024.1 hypothetical protein [Desmonostoc muscorum FACHB-395]